MAATSSSTISKTASFISTCRVPARAVRARPRHSRRGSRTCSGITSPRSWRCARFERARCALACLPLLIDIPRLPRRCGAESPIRASPPAEVEILAEHVAGQPLPPEVTAQIVAKTDGVPLFVEELTKAVLEGGLLVAGPLGWRLDGPLPPFAIPATLQDSLAARLDRLAPVKEIAQIGAAI